MKIAFRKSLLCKKLYSWEVYVVQTNFSIRKLHYSPINALLGLTTLPKDLKNGKNFELLDELQKLDDQRPDKCNDLLHHSRPFRSYYKIPKSLEQRLKKPINLYCYDCKEQIITNIKWGFTENDRQRIYLMILCCCWPLCFIPTWRDKLHGYKHFCPRWSMLLIDYISLYKQGRYEFSARFGDQIRSSRKSTYINSQIYKWTLESFKYLYLKF